MLEKSVFTIFANVLVVLKEEQMWGGLLCFPEGLLSSGLLFHFCNRLIFFIAVSMWLS